MTRSTYRVSLKKRSFRIPALMEALGYSKGLDISQKHCQTFFLVDCTTFNPIAHFGIPNLGQTDLKLIFKECSKFPLVKVIH